MKWIEYLAVKWHPCLWPLWVLIAKRSAIQSKYCYTRAEAFVLRSSLSTTCKCCSRMEAPLLLLFFRFSFTWWLEQKRKLWNFRLSSTKNLVHVAISGQPKYFVRNGAGSRTGKNVPVITNKFYLVTQLMCNKSVIGTDLIYIKLLNTSQISKYDMNRKKHEF